VQPIKKHFCYDYSLGPKKEREWHFSDEGFLGSHQNNSSQINIVPSIIVKI
jgi:hypothetical protein